MTMTQYDFWIETSEGEAFCCTVAQHRGSYQACLEAAASMWEACFSFGQPVTRHPLTGETPDEFRTRSGNA